MALSIKTSSEKSNPKFEINSFLNLNDLVPIPCEICKGNDTLPVAHMSRFQIPATSVICRTCGLIYFNPSMSVEQHAKFYERIYRLMHPVKGGDDHHYAQQLEEGKKILKFAKDALKPGASVLEVGCGHGGILTTLQEAGFKVFGIEPSTDESQYARNKGLNVETKLLRDLEGSPNRYDFIILSRTLNHLLRPSHDLRQMRNLLNPGGHLFISVIDFPTLCKYGKLTETAQLDHLYMFSSETLGAILRATGFNPLKIHSNENGSFLSINTAFHLYALAQRVESTLPPQYPNYQVILGRVHKNQMKSKIRGWIFRLVGMRWIKGAALRKA